jgi:hypothetical protein
MSKCECGRRKSKYLPFCKKCDIERTEKRNAEYRGILDAGCCPDCGSGLKQNLSITGWWQCEQFGAAGFRMDDNKPSCDFQFIIG